MSRYAKGDVVILPFPFSDATGAKRRPALVLAALPYFGGMDYLVCLITSRDAGDPHSIEIQPADLTGGAFAVRSYLRPLYLFAAEEAAVLRHIGTLAPSKVAAVVQTAATVLSL